jgi:hypothetical protein
MLFWHIFAANLAVILGTVLVGQCLVWLVERKVR